MEDGKLQLDANASSEFKCESVLLQHLKRSNQLKMKFVILVTFVLVVVVSVESTINFLKHILPGYGNGLGIPSTNYAEYEDLPGSLNSLRRRCPICDSSVYSYCTDKLFHDSCCCHNPNNPYDRLPFQCQFADCSFLHSNSCQEHKLITACCCISHLYKK